MPFKDNDKGREEASLRSQRLNAISSGGLAAAGINMDAGGVAIVKSLANDPTFIKQATGFDSYLLSEGVNPADVTVGAPGAAGGGGAPSTRADQEAAAHDDMRGSLKGRPPKPRGLHGQQSDPRDNAAAARDPMSMQRGAAAKDSAAEDERRGELVASLAAVADTDEDSAHTALVLSGFHVMDAISILQQQQQLLGGGSTAAPWPASERRVQPRTSDASHAGGGVDAARAAALRDAGKGKGLVIFLRDGRVHGLSPDLAAAIVHEGVTGRVLAHRIEGNSVRADGLLRDDGLRNDVEDLLLQLLDWLHGA